MTRYGAGKISGFGHSLLHHGRAGAILRVPKKRSGHLAVHRGRRRGQRREAFEEAGIPVTCSYSPLDTCCSIPADCFRDAEALWGQDCFVVPEYAFAVKVENTSLQLSREHTEYEWAVYARAYAMLQYDSNRTALWELNRRLELGVLN